MFLCTGVFIILQNAYNGAQKGEMISRSHIMSDTVRTRTEFYLRSKGELVPGGPGDQGSGGVYLICCAPQAALSIHGMCGGPMLGLFSLGILFPFVNWKVRVFLFSHDSQLRLGPRCFLSPFTPSVNKAICPY